MKNIITVTYGEPTRETPIFPAVVERDSPKFARVCYKGRWHEIDSLELLRLYIRLSHTEAERQGN